MFSWLKRTMDSLDAGRAAAGVHHVLAKTYSHDIDPSEMPYLMKTVRNWASFTNKHGLAVYYLANLSRRADPANPRASRAVHNWVAMAKGARQRQLFHSDAAVVALCDAVTERFGIDAAAIAAA